MISMIPKSRRLRKTNADNNRAAPLPSDETTRTCRHARNRSTCPRMKKSVPAAASRWQTSARATTANKSKSKPSSIAESFAANVTAELVTVDDQPRTVTAPLPPKLLPKSIYGTSLWMHLLLEKFHLQRPMHRTIEQLRLLGLSLAPGTIADGLKRIEPLLTPIYEAIRLTTCSRRTFKRTKHDGKFSWKKPGKSGIAGGCGCSQAKTRSFMCSIPSRSHDVPQSHFPDDVQGVMMVDRYSGYKAMQQVKEGSLVLAFCWAHVRRDFVRVGKGYPELRRGLLQWLSRIRELYRLNRERLRHPLGTAEFAAADARLRQHVAAMAAQRDRELADDKLREPCRKVACQPERTLERLDVVRR